MTGWTQWYASNAKYMQPQDIDAWCEAAFTAGVASTKCRLAQSIETCQQSIDATTVLLTQREVLRGQLADMEYLCVHQRETIERMTQRIAALEKPSEPV